jgi:hypothetical protein
MTSAMKRKFQYLSTSGIVFTEVDPMSNQKSTMQGLHTTAGRSFAYEPFTISCGTQLSCGGCSWASASWDQNWPFRNPFMKTSLAGMYKYQFLAKYKARHTLFLHKWLHFKNLPDYWWVQSANYTFLLGHKHFEIQFSSLESSMLPFLVK